MGRRAWIRAAVVATVAAIGAASASPACRKKQSEAAGQGIDAVVGLGAAGEGAAGDASAEAASGATSPATGEAYPVDDLLSALRPNVRERIASLIGVGRMSDLTLYEIDVTVDPDRGSFRAEQTIDFANRTGDPVTDVVLRVFGNMLGREGAAPPVTIRGAKVEGADAELNTLGPTTFRIALGKTVAAGERVTIEVAFEGRAPEQEPGDTTMWSQGVNMLKELLGFGGGGIEGYGILSMGDGIVSLAAWYPVVADYVRSERRWDAEEPSGIGDVGTSALANYRVRVHLPRDVTVASSGVLLDEATKGDEVVRTYGGAALRDFTLLVSRSYHVESVRYEDVRITAYVPGDREEFATRILDAAKGALETFERRFGPYALTELDVAAAPLIGGAGGVEFPGIVTVATVLTQDMSETMGPLGFLMPGGGERIPMLDEALEFVVVHETAHQWWNAMIGSDSIRHPFLDEALAQYSSILYFEDRYGAERAKTAGDRNVKMNYLVYRLLGSADGAADRATGDFSGAFEYAALVYGKAPYFYGAVREAIGDEKFDKAMHEYYEEYLYREAAPESFTVIAGEVSGRANEVAALHRRWLDEAHGDEDLGQASLGDIVSMAMGDAAGGMGDRGSLLTGCEFGDLGDIMGSLLGGAPGGGPPGGDEDDEGGAFAALPDLMDTIHRLLSQAGGANLGGLLDLVERIRRGELAPTEELMAAIEAALAALGDSEIAGTIRRLLPLIEMLLDAEEHSITGVPIVPGPPSPPAVTP